MAVTWQALSAKFESDVVMIGSTGTVIDQPMVYLGEQIDTVKKMGDVGFNRLEELFVKLDVSSHCDFICDFITYSIYSYMFVSIEILLLAS